MALSTTTTVLLVSLAAVPALFDLGRTWVVGVEGITAEREPGYLRMESTSQVRGLGWKEVGMKKREGGG